MKKNIVVRLGCVFITIILMMNLCGCDKASGIINAIKSNWKIELPEKLSLEFSKNEGPGDGLRYAVFKSESEPMEFLADFSREENQEFKNDVDSYMSRASFEVPENFLPDWESEYFWKHVGKNLRDGRDPIEYFDNMYMIYFPNSLKLIICQFFL